MSTYLQGVTDYIPDYQPFQPDLNFYANVLQTKQTQYDSNWKSVNNLYAELHNADLTHDQNLKKKDDLLKQIDFNVKRVSGLDLSLQQNVDQATQVFRPFYEDQYLMKDMAWTKNYNTKIGSALNLKNAQDEKIRAQYWDTGIKEMQYRKEEFKNSTLEETLNMGNVAYTPYVNAMDMYLKLAKDTGLSIDIKDVDESGMYFVREKNGKPLIAPLQNLFMSAYANNPGLQAVYATQSYVKRKDYADQYASKFNGDKLAAEKQYLTEQYNFLKNYASKKDTDAKEQLSTTEKKIASVEQDKEQGTANPYSDSYLESLNKALAINQGVADHTDKINKDINGGNSSTISTSAASGDPDALDLSDMQLARLRVDAGTASLLAEQDIIGSADIYAYRDYDYEKSANPVGVENMKQQHAIARMDYAHTLKTQEIGLEAAYGKLGYEKVQKGLKDGTLGYDKDGNIVDKDGTPINKTTGLPEEIDDNNTFELDLGSTSGQFTDEINVLKDNSKKYNDQVSNLTGEYIGNTLLRLKQLADSGEIPRKDLWSALSHLDPNSKEANERYGTTDGKKMLYKLWTKYENDPSKFILEFTKTNQVVKLKKFMDNWATVNYGKNIAVAYHSDPSGQKIEKYVRYRDQMAVVNKENETKIATNLVKSMDDLKVKPETKQKIAELYIQKAKRGEEMTENDFAKFLDKSITYTRPNKKEEYSPLNRDSFRDVDDIIGKGKSNAYSEYVYGQRQKWMDPNFWKTPEGKKIKQSGKPQADAFQEWVDDQGVKWAKENVSDQDFKKMLSKQVWRENESIKKRQNADTKSSFTGSKQDIEKVKFAKQELATLKHTLKTDDRDIYGPNKSRLKEEIAKKEKTIQFLEEKAGKTKDKEDNDYKKNLKKSPWSYTPEELDEAKDQYFRKLDKLNKGHGKLYTEIPEYKMSFTEKTGVDTDDLFETLSESYLKTITTTGEDGLKSYSGFVKTKGGRVSLGTNKITAKRVDLSNVNSSGFKDFNQIMTDLNRIRFSQNPESYAVTYGGLSKTAATDYALNASEIKAMLREMQMSAGKKTKMGQFLIGRSSIAMENAGLGAIVIMPPQSILEKYIKDDEGNKDWAKIKKIQQNGISFIAPRGQFTNDFFQENEVTPVQQILNAKKKIEWSNGNGAGSYKIEKVTGVAGVDYGVSYKAYEIQQDGSVEYLNDYLDLQRSGNRIDDTEDALFTKIQEVDMRNQIMYQWFQTSGNEEAMAKVKKYFKDNNIKGFKYD